MDAVVSSGMLGEGRIRALDGLAASGLRARRWLNETSTAVADRIDAVVCDIDSEALSWAMANHQEHPPNGRNGTNLSKLEGDLRQRILDGGWRWIDIDPFGSPVPFIDSAVQATARRAVLEVTATDVAALVGSKRATGIRRYGARVRLDGLAHDSGLRVLLATLARTAASHDRSIEPLLSIWDSHHLRVSVIVQRGAEAASATEANLGWRIADPEPHEVSASIAAGLHPHGEGVGDAPLQPHALLPLSHSIDRMDERVSGPLWTGALAEPAILSTMTEERALRLCSPTEDLLASAKAAGGDQMSFTQLQREAGRAVRHLAGEAELPARNGLFLVDHLHRHAPISSPPSPAKMVAALREAGHPAAIARYGEPAIRTSAPWSIIVDAAILATERR